MMMLIQPIFIMVFQSQIIMMEDLEMDLWVNIEKQGPLQVRPADLLNNSLIEVLNSKILVKF